jgi:CBS domain-containing protein
VNDMTAAQLMTRGVLTVDPEWSVERLMRFLSDNGISGAPVVGEEHKPIGVVSLTDIARNGAVTERAPDNGLEYYRRLEDVLGLEEMGHFHLETESRATVRDIMTPMVFAVDEDASVQEVAEMMITGRIHRVFVRQGNTLTGVVTSMDLLPLVRDM